MKKRTWFIGQFLLIFVLLVGCGKQGVTNKEKKELKETIDLVLSYENGYDEIMKKHISEKNFYVCNYKEFYSLYIGEVEIEKYESEIRNVEEKDGQYIVRLVLNIEAKAKEVHEEDGHENSDTATGEDIPLEVILKEKEGQYYITSFTEYENLEKAAELNEGFK